MRRRPLLLFLFLGLIVAPAVAQGDPDACDQPTDEPDVIVGSLSDVQTHGRVGDITAFSIGTTACNIGSCWLNWISDTPDHPVIGQNLFRLEDGRFEQIGQGWLTHRFAPLDGIFCSNECFPGDEQHLGKNCSDPSAAGLNGSQTLLGPKFEVNAADGTHLHPYTDEGQTGDAIYKRLQVHNDDLNPLLNPDALYFAEAQYVTADDAAFGNNANNNSYRAVTVSGTDPIFSIDLTDPTVQEAIALEAWRSNVPHVDLRNVPDGFVAGAAVTDLGGGMWHYEYAVQNVTSHQSARSFKVLLPHGALVANIGFHDVDYHSGEPYDDTDWAVTLISGSGPNSIEWSTQTFAENPNANALRWGTLYNFRFDSDAPPKSDQLSLGMFRPGNPAARTWITSAPDRCGDGFCEAPETFNGCSADCETVTAGAGRVPDGADVPGLQMLVERDNLTGELTLNWGDSCLATDSDYSIYSGKLARIYSHRSIACSTGGATIGFVPPTAFSTYYLIVPHDGIVEGSYGAATAGPRPAAELSCRPQQVGSCP